MNRKVVMILMLMSLSLLSSLKVQAQTKTSSPQALKYQGSVELDLAYPHVLGISTTHGVLLRDSRFYLGLGANAMVLKPSEKQKLGYYTPSSSRPHHLLCQTGLMDYTEMTTEHYLPALGLYSNFRFSPELKETGLGYRPYGELRLGVVSSLFGFTKEVMSCNFHGYSRLGLGLSYELNSNSTKKSRLRLNFALHIEYVSSAFAKSLHLADEVRVDDETKNFEHKIKPFNLGINIGLQF